MEMEMEAAEFAERSGVYVVWRCEETGRDCCRVGPRMRVAYQIRGPRRAAGRQAITNIVGGEAALAGLRGTTARSRDA